MACDQLRNTLDTLRQFNQRIENDPQNDFFIHKTKTLIVITEQPKKTCKVVICL